MKRFAMRKITNVLCLAGMLGISSQAMASAFQLWEQDGASVGSYHAGYAALANDASIAFYNPAGIIRIKNQQAVFAGVLIASDFKYVGNIRVNTIMGNAPRSVTAQGGQTSFVPALHYVAPINEWVGFGFSIDVPFGLATNYGPNTILRYAATKTSINAIDFSPSLGIKVTDKASVGFGLDVQRVFAEFDLVGGLGAGTSLDTTSTNKANDTAYGYHLGAMYQFTSDTRAGISYHSQVVHHLSGSSYFEGPLASDFGIPTVMSSRATTKVTLPAYTALSGYHKVLPNVAVMGTVIYTQWNTFRELTLNGISGRTPTLARSTNITVTIPQFYRNTWNLSLGSEYYLTDRVTLRGAIGYDETPVRNRYRNVQLPDNDRYVVAIGGHYQVSKAVGLDLGWTHFLINQSRVTPPTLVVGGQRTTTSGQASGGADVYSGQVTWDIA